MASAETVEFPAAIEKSQRDEKGCEVYLKDGSHKTAFDKINQTVTVFG